VSAKHKLQCVALAQLTSYPPQEQKTRVRIPHPESMLTYVLSFSDASIAVNILKFMKIRFSAFSFGGILTKGTIQ
jgi:hypothetical protein